MVRLTLTEPRYLKDSIAIISDLVNEARFKINQDGLELIAMDPANVAMVVFKLLSSCFTEYNVPEPTEIAINLANLKQVLRRTKPSDTLTLEYKDNRLVVLLRGDTTRTFNLPTIDLEEKEHRVPELSFPVKIKLGSHILVNAIEDADIVADSVAFIAEPNKFTISAEGELSAAKTEVTEKQAEIIAPEDRTKAKYSIEYLKKMIGGAKLADVATIQFSKDYPLKLEFKTVDRVLLSFILAPRIEND